MPFQLLNFLGALSWDPQVRGFLIVAAAIALLPGTIYLLLATNLGARMGFLLAVAGLSGWMMLLSMTWVLYAQGIKGRDPSWKVQEVVHSQARDDLSEGTLKAVADFPKGWHELPLTGSSILADSQAAADAFITKSGRKPKMGHEGPIIKDPTPAQLRFPAEFSGAEEYVLVGGYETGGDNCIGSDPCTSKFPKFIQDRVNHRFFFRHSPHYVVVQIRPAIITGKDAKGNNIYSTDPDTSKPITSVIVLRDLGSIRFPQVMTVISSGIIFFVTCHALHRRDKRIMALRAAGVAPASA